MIVIVAIALLAGVLIGCIGIGGVLLVSCLLSLGPSQAIQVPITPMASLGNLWTGSLDLVLAALLSVGVTFGSLADARVAHAVPAVFLARLVAVALALMGVIVAVRSGHALVETW
jgi:uncharacterized membrane protein YfcA